MNLNLTAPLNSLGYGVVSWNILKTMQKMGVEVALWPIGQPQLLTQDDEEKVAYQRATENKTLFNQYAPSLRIWHQFDMAQHIGKGLRCGLPFFELNRLQRNERHHLSYLDRILVPSKWAKQVIEREIPYSCDVRVVPMGVDRTIFSNEQVVTKPPQDETVFLNMGKWEIRKGHDILVEAFNDAFESNDKVRLVMACENPFLNKQQVDEWVGAYRGSRLSNKIVLTSRLDTHREVANLMGTAHCGVFPSRGEGWNMEALEMLSMGKHLIITDYSAHSDFCAINNSHLIPVQSTEPAYDGVWFHGTPNDRGEVPEWGHIGDVQYDALVQYLRDVHKQREQGGLPFNSEGIATAKKFSWENCCEEIFKAIDLTGQPPSAIIQS